MSFLITLRGKDDLKPAVDASRELTHSSQLEKPPSPAHASPSGTAE